MGLNGVDNGRLWFDGVRVPREALLNRFADVSEDGTYSSEIENPNRRFFTMLGTLVQGRVCVGGGGHQRQQGRAGDRGPLRASGAGSSRRRSEDEEELLLDYGQHQRRLFPLLAHTYALHFAQEVVAGQCHEVFSGEVDDEKVRPRSSSRGPPAPRRSAPGTRPAPSRSAARRAAARATSPVNRFAALKADTDVFTTFEGDNTVLLQLVAKGLLTDYSSEFQDLDQLGMVRFVAGLAVETVVERTNVHKLLERVRDLLPGGDQWDQEAGLLDSDYQLAMLRFREEHMLGRRRPPAQARHRREDEPGRGVLPGPGPRHPRGPRARRAAGARGVRREGPGRWRTATTRSRSACSATCTRSSTIEADRAWFMEHGRLTGSRSKAISREINALCRKLRPLARDLVDAFGVPEEMLRSKDLVGEPREAARSRRLVGRPALGLVLRLDGRAPDRRRRALGGRRSRATCACCTPPPARSAGSPRAPGCSTSRAAAGSPSAVCTPARASTTSPPTSPRRCSTGPRRWPREHGVADQVTTQLADVEALPFEDQSFDLVVSFTGLHCFPDPARAVVEMARVLKLGGVITGSALLNDTGLRFEPMRRAGRLAGLLGPGLHVRPGPALAGAPGHRRRDARRLRRDRVLPRRPPERLSARCSPRTGLGRP